LDASGLASVTAAGIDDGSSDNCSILSMSLDVSNFGCTDVGNNTVSLTVTDVNGNIRSGNSTVTVLDTIKPVISSCPLNIVASNDIGNCSAVVNWTPPTAADNCNIDSIVSNFNPGDVFPLGITTVTYIAYDPSMNTDTCTFTIEVFDGEDPIIANIPADITVNNDVDECGAIVNWAVLTATDNCQLDSLTNDFSSGDMFPVGTTTVTYIAYDASLNTDTVRFNVTVIDNQLPTIVCPADEIICVPTLVYNAPVVDDNCGVASVIQTAGLPSGSTFPIGVTTNTFVVTDDNGNVDSCSFDVTRGALPTADVGPDQSIFKDDGLDLSVKSDSNNAVGTSYLWMSGPDVDAKIDDPSSPTGITRAFPPSSTFIWATVTSSLGCESSDTLFVTVNTEVTISTAFTPNGDGINDVWLVKNLNEPEIASYKVSIFDGFGSEVLATSDFQGWDGKYNGEDLPGGVSYYYVIEYERTDGTSEVETGIVTILR